jgi:hypothetical protein
MVYRHASLQIPGMGITEPGRAYKTLPVLFGGAGQCCTYCAAQNGSCAAWTFDEVRLCAARAE